MNVDSRIRQEIGNVFIRILVKLFKDNSIYYSLHSYKSHDDFDKRMFVFSFPNNRKELIKIYENYDLDTGYFDVLYVEKDAHIDLLFYNYFDVVYIEKNASINSLFRNYFGVKDIIELADCGKTSLEDVFDLDVAIVDNKQNNELTEASMQMNKVIEFSLNSMFKMKNNFILPMEVGEEVLDVVKKTPKCSYILLMNTVKSGIAKLHLTWQFEKTVLYYLKEVQKLLKIEHDKLYQKFILKFKNNLRDDVAIPIEITIDCPECCIDEIAKDVNEELNKHGRNFSLIEIIGNYHSIERIDYIEHILRSKIFN